MIFIISTILGIPSIISISTTLSTRNLVPSVHRWPAHEVGLADSRLRLVYIPIVGQYRSIFFIWLSFLLFFFLLPLIFLFFLIDLASNGGLASFFDLHRLYKISKLIEFFLKMCDSFLIQSIFFIHLAEFADGFEELLFIFGAIGGYSSMADWNVGYSKDLL